MAAVPCTNYVKSAILMLGGQADVLISLFAIIITSHVLSCVLTILNT